MSEQPDIIGIHHHVENGVTHFGCRGIGKTYAEFYEWVRTTSYACDSTDWPWDYFHFKNEADAQELFKRYGKQCYEAN